MASPKWWSKDVVAVVTGSSEGIGLEIVRQLAEKGITVVSTARNEQKGLAAIELLKSQGLDVYFHPLDFSSTSSVSQLASWLNQRFSGVDILINNAGIVNDEANYESVKQVIETSYEGVKRVTKGLLPIMKASPAGSRIINISSSLGQVGHNNEHHSLQAKVSRIQPLTEEKLDAFVQHFLEDVKAGVDEENGWPTVCAAFIVSKVAVNAYTRLLAKSLENLPVGQKVYANGLWLGFLKGMNMNNINTEALITIEQGADTPVWLALLPPPEVPIKGHYFRVPHTGQYFRLRHFIQF